MQKPNIGGYQKPEPVWKAVVSLPFAMAFVGLTVFCMSLGSIDKMAVGPGSLESTNESRDVMRKAEELKPMKLLKSGKRMDAINEAQKLVDYKPRDVSVQVCAALVYIRVGGAGLRQDALNRLKAAVAMAPRNREIRILYARTLANSGDWQKAMDQYQQLINASPSWYEPKIERAQLIMLYQKPTEAANAFHEIAEDNPNHPEARLQAGIALARAGKADDGLEEYMKGIEAEKSIDKPRALKQILTIWDTLEKAKYDLERRVASSPEDPMLLMRLAEVNLYMDNLEAAKDNLQQCKKKSSTNWEVKRMLAIVYYRLGMRKQAAQEFNQSVTLEKKAQDEQTKKKKVFS